MPLSKSQVDQLGERLKRGPHTEDDLRLLDQYRRSFGEAYEFVVQRIRALQQAPTGRPAKSTGAIVAKLRRESIRLSQIQDIAGCRIVVASLQAQDELVAELLSAFPESVEHDRREKPSHGYRAVHVVASVGGKPVEIQVRTTLQHLWAQLSEKASDVWDPEIKYGGGPRHWQDALSDLKSCSALLEERERILDTFDVGGDAASNLRQARGKVASLMQEMIGWIDARKQEELEP